MKKIFFLLAVINCIAACTQHPWVKHKVILTKMNDDCDHLSSYFKMTSDFGGERFQFEECLPGDFTDKNITSARQGDTVVVKFEKSSKDKPLVFDVTLDVDSYPEYNFITIGDNTYPITHSR